MRVWIEESRDVFRVMLTDAYVDFEDPATLIVGVDDNGVLEVTRPVDGRNEEILGYFAPGQWEWATGVEVHGD